MRESPAKPSRMQSNDNQEAPKEPLQVGSREQSLKELEAALGLLGKHDDTSRFVGLALLKPVLEQELGQHDTTNETECTKIVQRSWDAIPATFLDRLMKARPDETRTKEEANNMNGLAVAVLQAFMGLLNSPHTDQKFMGRVPMLKRLFNLGPPEMKVHIMEIIHCIAKTPEGCSTLFRTDLKDGNLEQSPSSYLLLSTIHVDILTTIRSLQTCPHSDDYTAISIRISRDYDVLSAFIAFLIKSVTDIEDDGDPSDSTFVAPMPMDQLLKLRQKVTEIMFETIVNLRKRYDACQAGVLGLQLSAHSSNGENSGEPRLTAAGTSSAMLSDPLVLSQIRALSLWLRDEENDSLRSNAAGVMDVLLALYQTYGAQDFQFPILFALEGILETRQGVSAFLKANGWMVLLSDLRQILSDPAEGQLRSKEIINMLIEFLQFEDAVSAEEEWIQNILQVNDTLMNNAPAQYSELVPLTYLLALYLLSRGPSSVRSKYRPSAIRTLNNVHILLMRGNIDAGIREELECMRDILRSSWALTDAECWLSENANEARGSRTSVRAVVEAFTAQGGS